VRVLGIGIDGVGPNDAQLPPGGYRLYQKHLISLLSSGTRCCWPLISTDRREWRFGARRGRYHVVDSICRDKFIEPVLRYLATHPDGVPARDVHKAAADALGLTEADRSELLPSGVQPVFKNRAGWAHDRLKRAGLSTSRQRGFWQLTEAGRNFARTQPTPLQENVLEDLITEHTDVRLRPLAGQPASRTLPVPSPDRAPVSPDDRLEQALAELRQGVIIELLELLSQVSSQYFETIVLDLLHKMGYGTSRADLRRVGRAGDGGIDGVISLDRLGLEKVYVQAKRWQNAVGRPEVQAFYGALAGQRANKGVFITTSSFTGQAVEFAGSVERVVLVDGAKLAELMIEHEVGVASRSVRVPKIDSDYFEE
jgi:restriction system protein